jgi:hypothetical protein
VFRGLREEISNSIPRHAAPDPMLLVLKAATAWSFRQQRPLLGGMIPKRDIGDNYVDEFSDTDSSYYEELDELQMSYWDLDHLIWP